MIGQNIFHYKILEKIGSGGMGVVYKAEDTKLKRKVALKFLPPDLTRDPEAKERFIQEAQTASALDHNNICTIHEINETEKKQLFIVMACYDGITLKDKIEKGPLSEEEAINITAQIGQGLAKAHEKGIIHRDIKPANIMITKDNVVKILDFGLAKLAGQTKLTKSGSTLGTVAYMSPEQARGDQVDRRTDIWSLGVLFYEMLTGQLPYKGEYDHAVIYSILNEEAEQLSDIKPDISIESAHIVEKTLVKEPNERYQQINDLLDDFKNLKAGVEINSLPPQKKEFKKSKSKILPKYIPIFAGVILLIIISFFILKFFLFEEVLGSDPVLIVVLPFENHTGIEIYDTFMQNTLISKLVNSPYLQVITIPQLNDIKKQLNIEDEKIDEQLGFEICKFDGIDALVTGSITKTGEQFVTVFNVYDVDTKNFIESDSEKGNNEESIYGQIDKISDKISKIVNLSDKEIAANQKPVIEMTSSSPEAINSYTKGVEAQCRYQIEIARSYYEKAIDYDTTYARAYLGLVDIFGFSYGDKIKAQQYYEKAKKYSQKLNRKDKLYFDRYQATYEEGNRAKSIEITKILLKEFPREKMPHVSLGWHYFAKGQVIEAINETQIALNLDPDYEVALKNIGYFYTEKGNYEQAIKYHKKLISVSQNSADAYDSMGDTYQRMGQLDEAIKNHEEAVILFPDLGSQWKIAYSYALKQNYPAAQKWITKYIRVMKMVRYKVTGYIFRLLFHLFSGEHNQMVSDFDSLSVIIEADGDKSLKSFEDYFRGLIYYETGKLDSSQIKFDSWIKATSGSKYMSFIYDFHSGLIELNAEKVDSAKAKLSILKSLLSGMEKQFYTDELKFKYEILKGEMLLMENSFDKIIDNRKNYLLPHNIDWTYFFFPERLIRYNFPFTVDVLARTYHKKEEFNKAIKEYERLTELDFKNKPLRLINPKYHYRLAKLYEEIGENKKAVDHYKIFLEIWKNADEDLEELLDAERRMTRLTGNM